MGLPDELNSATLQIHGVDTPLSVRFTAWPTEPIRPSFSKYVIPDGDLPVAPFCGLAYPVVNPGTT